MKGTEQNTVNHFYFVLDLAFFHWNLAAMQWREETGKNPPPLS